MLTRDLFAPANLVTMRDQLDELYKNYRPSFSGNLPAISVLKFTNVSSFCSGK